MGETSGKMRLVHRKLRTGCRQCRRRKIKVGLAILPYPITLLATSVTDCGSPTSATKPNHLVQTARNKASTVALLSSFPQPYLDIQLSS